MIFIDIPECCKIHKEIPKEKIIDTIGQKEIADIIKRIYWTGCIKPGVYDVSSTVNEWFRYEEIQFMIVELQSRDRIYQIGNCIYSKIKYPCVIEFHVDDSVIIGACSFNAGKIDESDNVNKKIVFSHILRKEFISDKAQKMISTINELIKNGGEIGNIYNSIYDEILYYSLSGTSKAHVDRLIVDMLGKTSSKRKAEICRYCVPYEYHAPVSGTRKYQNCKETQYSLIHDYEEIWFSFLKDTEIKNVIEARRYRDIEDLIYSIDSKSW